MSTTTAESTYSTFSPTRTKFLFEIFKLTAWRGLVLLGIIYVAQWAVKSAMGLAGFYFVNPIVLQLTPAVLTYFALQPLVEELVFRGFLQSSLTNKDHPIDGVVYTAMIYAGCHFLLYQSFVAVAVAFVIGLILGVTKYQHGSLGPNIMAQYFNNAILLTLLKFGR